MPRRLLQVMRAVAALSAIVVLVAGIPAGLAATVGNPLQAWPDLLAGDLSDRTIVAVLGAVAWVAWVQFAAAVALELLSALAGVRVPVRIPGFLPGQRQLAQALVAAAFALTPLYATGPAQADAGTLAVSTVAAAPASFMVTSTSATPATTTTVTPAATVHARTGDAALTYTVRDDGPGTYWDLAEHFLGDGTQWQRIWAVNEGRQQPDGATMTAPGLLRPGWTVRLPADAVDPQDRQDLTPTVEDTVEVTVQRGDTLTSIAADHDVEHWNQLWEENRGRAQPDGRRFTDPDVLLPGWALDVPATAATAADPPVNRTADTAPTTAPADNQTAPDENAASDEKLAAPDKKLPDEKPREVAPAAEVDRPTVTAGPDERVRDVVATPAPTPSAAPSTAVATEVAPAPSAEPVVDPQQETDDTSSTLAATLFGAGGLLLAGVSAEALRRHRRRQLRHRRPGRAIAATPAPLALAERAVTAGVGVVDVRWLNEALRGLVHQQAHDPDGALPDVLAARLSPVQLELVLATSRPQAPGAWMVDGTGTRWTLDRGASTGFDPDGADHHLAPYPTLASVGVDARTGDQWLLDLERVGSLALTGDTARCQDLARFIAAELAHNTWSEQLSVTLAGFGAELVDLNPDRVSTTTDPEAAVTRAVTQLRNVQFALRAARTDVLSARLRDVAADMVFPHVVVVADLTDNTPDADDLADAMAPLLGAGDDRSRTASALVVTGRGAADCGAHWEVTVTADGRLDLPQLGLTLVAQQLPAPEAAQLAQLLAVAARTEDRPMPVAQGEDSWQGLADLAGAPRAELLAAPDDSIRSTRTGGTGAADSTVSVTTDSTPAAVRPDRVLPLPPASYLEHTATTGEDLQVLAPAVLDDAERQVNLADPELEEDLVAWGAADCARPRLSVLGPLTLRAGTDPQVETHRRAWTTEVVAYLACHPRGVTAEQLAADLWPNDPHTTMTSKVRQTIYMIRKRLGADPVTGADYVPTAVNPTGGPGRYRIDGMLVDADLFRRLRLRGVARGADGIGDLQTALDLVTGPPFTDRRPGGYAWLADDPLDHTYTAMIVDVAHVVATHHLAAGRPELAAAAAQVALTAGSTDDVALLDLVAACDAQGNRAEADRLVTRILANHDAEVEEDLPPRTAEVLHRRRWLDRAG